MFLKERKYVSTSMNSHNLSAMVEMITPNYE